MAIRILFVGNDESVRKQVLHLTTVCNYQSESVKTAEEAIELLNHKAFEMLVTDVVLPGLSGLDLLSLCRRQWPDLITTVITEEGTIDLAVNAMKRGASDVFAKPVALETLKDTIQTAAERVSSRAAASPSRAQAGTQMVAQSHRMRKVLDQATAIAPFNTTVLVTGESGTGKELIARAIHEQSVRQQRPFVALNCAAIPDQLLEDELFGHVKGAFTGAQSAREGRFEHAEGGTLFLDEIGDMSLSLQAKLLRVLQEREFEKLGSSRTIKVDVRIIAATSADLEQKIKDGSFRLDLYYRLNVMHLRLPPLRERPEDIRPLAEQLLSRFCSHVGLPSKRLDEGVWGVLASYHWPGNVRQLQNAMERAAALSGAATLIGISDLPEEIRDQESSGAVNGLPVDSALLSQQAIPVEGVSLEAVVTNIERELLLRSLSQTGGNKMQAAKLLKMKRTTFVEKLKRLQIDEPDEAVLAGFAAPASGGGVFSGFASTTSQ
jgi:DNA-binding NtrC family response regulator